MAFERNYSCITFISDCVYLTIASNCPSKEKLQYKIKFKGAVSMKEINKMSPVQFSVEDCNISKSYVSSLLESKHLSTKYLGNVEKVSS
ncbi:hypothetical protein C0J52_27486 [Blattella germanica]|nr:hypothetical protein C0J52_27486 [Blattella germanica]